MVYTHKDRGGWLTCGEAADRLGIDSHALRHLRRKGDYAGRVEVRDNGWWMFWEADVESARQRVRGVVVTDPDTGKLRLMRPKLA